VEWPGFRTTANHAMGETQAITKNWMGSLLEGQRDAGGQMYMRNRYYDPATGQFTQTDPIGIAGGLNTYGFANGDPVSYSDPYGLCGKEKDEAPCPNKKADGTKPWYEDHNKNTVQQNNSEIDAAATATGVDGRLIRSIMYMETTHGYYDVIPALFDMNSSVLPMNVRTDLWGPRLGYTREQLKNPSTNIMAGAQILQGIMSDLPAGATVAEIATRYNNGRAGVVNDYGARVSQIYRTQPWLIPVVEPSTGCMTVGYGCSTSRR
jgi:RHS repeat-associated protein